MENKKTTLIEAMNRAHLLRKYYLHRRIKSFTQVKSKQRCVELPSGSEASITKKQQEYINELIANYGYSPQICIPVYKKNNYGT